MEEKSGAGGIKLVVGLGNPGPRYARTRHNAGFMALEELASRWGTSFRKGRTAEKAEVLLGGRRVILLRPLTFMNLSGEAVRPLRRRTGLKPEEVLVVHDDIDLGEGEVRVKRGGSSGGHLGVQSVVENLGSSDFLRVRLGVGRPPTPEEAAAYVLETLDEEGFCSLENTAARGADAVECVLLEGEEEAMRRFNRRGAVSGGTGGGRGPVKREEMQDRGTGREAEG